MAGGATTIRHSPATGLLQHGGTAAWNRWRRHPGGQFSGQWIFLFLSFFLYCFTVTRSKKKYRRKKNRKLKTEGQSAIQTDSLNTIKNKLIRNGVHEVIENT